MESKWFHHISPTKYIFPFFPSKMIALHQIVANCQNTLTVFTQRWRILLQDFLLLAPPARGLPISQDWQIVDKNNTMNLIVPYQYTCALPRTGRMEMFNLTTHSTHFIYGYMASDIWLRTILIVRKDTRCRHIGYSFRLTARVLLYAPSHRQDSTYHGLCYTSCGALAGTRNSSMGPPHEGSIRRPIAPWANALPLSYVPPEAVPVSGRVRNLNVYGHVNKVSQILHLPITNWNVWRHIWCTCIIIIVIIIIIMMMMMMMMIYKQIFITKELNKINKSFILYIKQQLHYLCWSCNSWRLVDLT